MTLKTRIVGRACILALGTLAATLALNTAAQAETITLMGYRAGGFQENYIKAVIEPFQKANPDIKVEFYGVQNSATGLGLLRAQKNAPQIDAVIYDLSVAQIAKEEKLIEPIDPKAVPNYAKLKNIGRELGLWAPPITYDTLALIYHRAQFPEAPKSWKVLWDPAYKRKVAIPARGGADIQAIALTIVANRMAGKDDYKSGIQPGIDLLSKLGGNIQTWEPQPDQYTLVAAGTDALSVAWNARSQHYIDTTQGKLGSTAPEEGTVSQINVISQVAGGKHKAAVEKLIDYALSAPAQKAFSELMFYAPSNAEVTVSPELEKRIPLLDKKNEEKLIPVDWIAVAAMREDITKAWRRQVIPAGR